MRPVAAFLVGVWLAGSSACGGGPRDDDRFLSLLDLVPRRTGQGLFEAELPRLRVERLPDFEGVLLVHELAPEDWIPAPEGRWQLARPTGFPRGALEVRQGQESLAFGYLDDALVLFRKTAAPPPMGTTLRVRVTRDAPGEFGGLTVPLWPGEELAYDLPAGAARALLFESLLPGAFGPQLEHEVVLEVEFDGARLGDARLRPARGPVRSQHEFELPERSGTLVLRARGGPLQTNLLSPVLAPRARGTPTARPWPDARPDLIVFLADTFRADLLASHGGDPALTPHLNALAARSLRFIEARSPSTWTLPAHASLFTGLWPGQHGAETPERTFDPALVTLAETLRAAGYRTGAVTQGGYVTRDYALDQGFEYFREQSVSSGPMLAALLAEASAFLAADDGRPTFLFVHTYRTHSPYRPDASESKERYQALQREALESGFTGARQREFPAEKLAELRALYEAGAHTLDAAFGPWFAELERSGRLARGLFVFTSDHGEAFFEHGRLMHGEAPHEEVARIPLFLFGAGVAPGDVHLGASLLDLHPTLLARAGVALSPGLAGQDLLTLEHERTLVTATRMKQGHFVAVVEGVHKLHAHHAVEVELPRDIGGVFDLARDPLERESLPTPGSGFQEAARAAWQAAARPRAPWRPIELDEAKLDELRALGYGD